MDYKEYLIQNQRELESLRPLMRVYMPPFLKEQTADSLTRAILILDQYKERLELNLDNIEEPF
jgi:hypothetical protein